MGELSGRVAPRFAHREGLAEQGQGGATGEQASGHQRIVSDQEGGFDQVPATAVTIGAPRATHAPEGQGRFSQEIDPTVAPARSPASNT